MTRFLSIAIALVWLLVPAFASAQFGGLIKTKKKFDMKKVEKLERRIDKVVKEYEDGSEGMWTATENVQSMVGQYKDGDFPVLTKNWSTIRKEVVDVEKDAGKRAEVLKQRALYFDEMGKRKTEMETFLSNSENLTQVKGKLTVPEKKQLTDTSVALKKVPKKDQALLTKSQTLIKDSGKMITDLGKQISKDPRRANDYQKVIVRLQASTDRLTGIADELGHQLDASKTMVGVIGKLLAD